MNQLSIFDQVPEASNQFIVDMYIVTFKTNRIQPHTLIRLKQWIKCKSEPMCIDEIHAFIATIKTNQMIKKIQIKKATGNPAAHTYQKPTF